MTDNHLNQQQPIAAGKAPISARTSGVVLLVTMVVLLVLATLGYSLAIRVAAQRHRYSFLIDYTNACYARDSALKYALTTLQDLNNVNLISRPNEPDFSDLFSLSEPDYRRLLDQWAAELAKRRLESSAYIPNLSGSALRELGEDENAIEPNAREPNIREPNNTEPNSLEPLTIPGPYGPPWPLITEPVEFEIGPATVKIEIEDENAKFPVGWAVLDDEKVKREAEASVETFCEWMGFGSDQIDLLKEQMNQVRSIRPFKVAFEPITQRVPINAPPAGRRRGRTRVSYKTVTTQPAEQIIKQTRDFSRLFHSSIIDIDMLAQPTIISEERKESALKYMSLWGTTQVNINSAPRQVLEAAFTFGGDAAAIASEVIKRRKEKPFSDFSELRSELFRFSDKIDKCKPYITARSDVFTIRVTATSGVARATAVIVVLKTADKIEKVTVMCG